MRSVLPFARVDCAEPTLLTQEYAGSAVEVAAGRAAAGQPRVGKSLATEIATDRVADRYTASCERARRLLARGRPADALNTCARAAALVKEGWEVHLLTGVGHAAIGAVEEARSEFELVLHLEPGCAPAARGLASAVAILEGDAAAAPYWQRVADLLEYWGPDSSLTSGAAGPPRQQLSRAGLAHRFLRGCLWEHAVQEARACLDVEPGRSDLVIVLIRALWRSHQLAEAQAALVALLSRQPLSLPANLLAAVDAEVNGGDSSRPLAMARRVDPLLRGAFRVLDASELALLDPDLETPGRVKSPTVPARPLPAATLEALSPAAAPQPPVSEPAPSEPAVPTVLPASAATDEEAPAPPAAVAGPEVAAERHGAVAEADDSVAGEREVSVAATVAAPEEGEDIGASTTVEAPGTAEEWRAVGDERRRQGDFAGAIEAYAKAMALLGRE